MATLSAACIGELTRDGLKGTNGISDRATLMEKLQKAGEARTTEARGESVSLNPIVPDNAADLPDSMPTLFKEGSECYHTSRGQHPNSTNRFPTRSFDLVANYSSFAFNHLISPRPLLMIAGSEADTLYCSKDAIELASEPKELFKIEGKTHVDLYDDTSVSIPKLVYFMSNALCV